MSHYSRKQTQCTEPRHIVAALCDMGFRKEQIHLHETAVHLLGIGGTKRPETAEIQIHRQHVGRAANDLGFKREADGTYTLIVSDWEQRHGYGVEWQNKLKQRYAVHVAKALYEAQGFAVIGEDTRPDGTIDLILERYSEKITFTLDTSGMAQAHVQGVAGVGCETLTAGFFAALGPGDAELVQWTNDVYLTDDDQAYNPLEDWA